MQEIYNLTRQFSIINFGKIWRKNRFFMSQRKSYFIKWLLPFYIKIANYYFQLESYCRLRELIILVKIDIKIFFFIEIWNLVFDKSWVMEGKNPHIFTANYINQQFSKRYQPSYIDKIPKIQTFKMFIYRLV